MKIVPEEPVDERDDDTPPSGLPRAEVPGGEIGRRLDALEVAARAVEARLTVLDGKHDEATAARAALREDMVTRLDAIIAAHQQTVALRAFACIDSVAGKMFTPTSAPIYAAAVLVFAVALTATTIRYGELVIGRTVDAAANTSDASDDAGSDAGISGPEPEP